MSTQKSSLQDTLLSEALERFNRVQTAQQPVRELSKADRSFAVIRGAQWQGTFDQRYKDQPKIEVNKIARSIKRVTSEFRQNKTTTQFTAKSEGVAKDDEIADVATGKLRSDEKDSSAGEAYDNAWQEGVTGGFGAWRLRTDYEDELNENDDEQVVCFEPIYEADQSVYFDPNAKRYDKSDAEYCFVIHGMTREAYKDTYGDDVASWPKTTILSNLSFQWVTPDLVYIAEYYTVHKKTDTINVYGLIGGGEEEYSDEELRDDPDIEDRLQATGARKLRTYKHKRRVVKKTILSGGAVLEKPTVIAGKYIPVVPFYGQRWYIDGVEHYAGETRHARDAQILQNVMVTKMLEIVSYSGREVPIFTPQEVQGHIHQWQDRAVNNAAFLYRNPTVLNGQEQIQPIEYLKNPDVPPALAGLHQVATADLQDILGKSDPQEETNPNISGKAIELIQQRFDEQSFVYLDNMAKSREHSAKVWLSMTKDIIRNRQKIKVLGDDGKVAYKTIAMPMVNQETGGTEYYNDLLNAELHVSVSIGPSTESKRNAIVRQLTGVLQMAADPEQQKMLMAVLMMNMQGEGLSEVNQYYRKFLVQAGVVKPTPEEEKELQAKAQEAQKPDPQAEYLMASAQKQAADAVQSQAKTENIQADTMQKMAELQNGAAVSQ